MRIKLPQVSGVYQIYCLASQKCYIGSATNLRRRWFSHRWALRRNKHRNQHLQNAWNKYGETMFDCVVIEHTNKDQNLSREQYYLDLLCPFRPEVGYNIGKVAGAAMLGKTHSKETRARMGDFRRGKKLSPETCKQMSDSQKGRKFSHEHVAKLCIGQKARQRSEQELAQCREWGLSRKGTKVEAERKRKQVVTLKKTMAEKRNKATHCKHGHPWNSDNVRFQKSKRSDMGKIRYCRTCMNLRAAISRMKRRESQCK